MADATAENSPCLVAEILVAEICAHDGDVIFGQTAQQFVLKVIRAGGYGTSVALLKRAATLVDVFLQTIIQVFVTPPFSNLGLIVELDFIDQQAREPLRLAVYVRIFG